MPWACLQYSAINFRRCLRLGNGVKMVRGLHTFSMCACLHSSHVVLFLSVPKKYRICVFSKPDAPLRTVQWDGVCLAQSCSCLVPEVSKHAKFIVIYQKILQFNFAHLIEFIFLQIFPQSICLTLLWPPLQNGRRTRKDQGSSGRRLAYFFQHQGEGRASQSPRTYLVNLSYT